MSPPRAAEAVVLLHFAFVLFVGFGGLLVIRYGWLAALHLPAVAWGIFIEVSGRVCPLTFVENALRREAGEPGYRGGFIEHYIYPILYPPGLDRTTQFAIAALVFTVNGAIYAWITWRWLRRRARPDVRGR